MPENQQQTQAENAKATTKAVPATNLTEEDKVLLDAVVDILNIMADENELGGRVAIGEHPLLVESWKYPGSELRSYMNRLRKWMQTSTETFVVACCLMKRLDDAGALPSFTQASIHRVYLVCLMLAIKCQEDVTLSNFGFAKVGGVTAADLAQMEMHALLALNWRVQVTPEEYEAMQKDVVALASSMNEPTFFDGLPDELTFSNLITKVSLPRLAAATAATLSVEPVTPKRKVSRKLPVFPSQRRLSGYSLRNLMHGSTPEKGPMRAARSARMARQDSV